MNEHELQRECNEFLRGIGVPFYHREKGRGVHAAHSAGLQDLTIFASNGQTVCVELKTSDGVLSDAQILWRDKLRLHGHYVYVIKSLEEFLKLLKSKGII